MTRAVGFLLMLALIVGYVAWLDAGCGSLGGVMTWEGKVCVQDL